MIDANTERTIVTLCILLLTGLILYGSGFNNGNVNSAIFVFWGVVGAYWFRLNGAGPH